MYTTDVFIGSVASVEFYDMEYNEMKTNRYLNRPDLLMEVRDCIANNPQRFTYGSWFKGGKLYESTGKQMQCNDNWCGTMACVAGHAIALSCPAETPIRQFMMQITGDRHTTEPHVANYIFEVNEDYRFTISKFLYSPWYWDDKNGNHVEDDIDRYGKLAVLEAVARINWILDDHPLEEYVIAYPELINQEDAEG